MGGLSHINVLVALVLVWAVRYLYDWLRVGRYERYVVEWCVGHGWLGLGCLGRYITGSCTVRCRTMWYRYVEGRLV